MRSWKAFMELRARQVAALQAAFNTVAAAERRVCKAIALRRWREVADEAAQVRLLLECVLVRSRCCAQVMVSPVSRLHRCIVRDCCACLRSRTAGEPAGFSLLHLTTSSLLS